MRCRRCRRSFWIIVTFLAVTGGILLLLDLGLTTKSLFVRYRARQIDGATAVRVFLLLAAGIYLAPIIAAGFFDRYLLPPVFLLLALLMSGAGGMRRDRQRGNGRGIPVRSRSRRC